MRRELKLTVNREKMRIMKLHQPGASLNFLGFTLRYDRDRKGRDHRDLNLTPSAKAVDRACVRIRELTSARNNCRPIEEVVGGVTSSLRSWATYYRYGYPRQAFREVNWFVHCRLVRHLQRRSQRPFRLPEGDLRRRWRHDADPRCQHRLPLHV